MQHRESVLRLQSYRPIPLRLGVREVPASMFPLASGRLSPHEFVTEGGAKRKQNADRGRRMTRRAQNSNLLALRRASKSGRQ